MIRMLAPVVIGSIPHISLVKRDLVTLQELPELLLKRDLPMVLFLVLDVTNRGIRLRFADGKCAVSRLPGEAGHALGLHPFGGTLLHLLHEVCLGDGATQSVENVDMVGHTAGSEGR